MPLVQISKPRPGMHRLGAALRILPGPRAAVWPLILAWGILCGMLAFMPGWWVTDWREAQLTRWFDAAHAKAARLTQEWEHWSVGVPAFSEGGEPVVKVWLEREAFVTALVDSERGQVWLRDGGRLRLARDARESSDAADLTRRAMEASGAWTSLDLRGHVPRAQRLPGLPDAGSWWHPPFSRGSCSIVTFYGKWVLIKRFTPGDTLERQWLQGTLGAKAESYRFGVFSGFTHRTELSRPRSIEGFRPPEGPVPAQITNLEDAPFRVEPALSEPWGGYSLAVIQMGPEAFRTFRRAYHLRQAMAWTSYALLVGASGLALAVLLFTRNREKVLADRLASLTHNLKTPLAVLQLRCDTALNPDLPRESQEARLLEIQSEARRLTRTIEAGLEEMRSRYRGRSLDRVDGEFFERLDEDFTPAFEQRNRLLEVLGGGVSVQCNATVLRTALATLVENALLHGEGTVVVQAVQFPGRVRITTSDEGAGIPQAVLATLKPSAPAEPAGTSMGLLVLARLARQEGWGLAFDQGEGPAAAILEIPSP